MELHANSLAEKMSRLGDGTFIPLHAPARVSSTLVRDELMKEESVQDAVKLMNRIDVALVESVIRMNILRSRRQAIIRKMR